LTNLHSKTTFIKISEYYGQSSLILRYCEAVHIRSQFQTYP
jgi:hypothetical protein